MERCNSRLKHNLTVDDVHVRGIQKVTTYVYLNVIVLLASALAMNATVNVPENGLISGFYSSRHSAIVLEV